MCPSSPEAGPRSTTIFRAVHPGLARVVIGRRREQPPAPKFPRFDRLGEKERRGLGAVGLCDRCLSLENQYQFRAKQTLASAAG